MGHQAQNDPATRPERPLGGGNLTLIWRSSFGKENRGLTFGVNGLGNAAEDFFDQLRAAIGAHHQQVRRFRLIEDQVGNGGAGKRLADDIHRQIARCQLGTDIMRQGTRLRINGDNIDSGKAWQ